MAGFKKCGVYPLSPGEVTDHQIAPSKAVCPTKESDGVCMSPPESTTPDPDYESVFQNGFEEGYEYTTKLALLLSS